MFRINVDIDKLHSQWALIASIIIILSYKWLFQTFDAFLLHSSLYACYCLCQGLLLHQASFFFFRESVAAFGAAHFNFYRARFLRLVLGPAWFRHNNDFFCRCRCAIQNICVNCKSCIRTHIRWWPRLSNGPLAPLVTIAWTTSGTGVLHTVSQWLARRPWLAQASWYTNPWLICASLTRDTRMVYTWYAIMVCSVIIANVTAVLLAILLRSLWYWISS